MTKTLKSLRRVKEKGVAVIDPTLLIILKDSIIPLVILFRFVTYADRCLLVKCRFLSDTLSSYRDTIGLHLSSWNNTSLATYSSPTPTTVLLGPTKGLLHNC